MGGPARPLHEPGNHRSSERCSHRHSADCGSLIERPTLLRITAPTPRPGARSWERRPFGTEGYGEMRITAYSYTGDRVLRIMDPSRNPQFNVRPDITGISAEGLEISCEGGPPDRRVE